MRTNKKIFISAGEASGDLHGASLLRALAAREPGVRAVCLGGGMLRAAGAEVLVDNRELSVVGISEVLGHARVIYAAWRKIMDYLEKERPSLVVLIDFPDFNFLLARAAKRLGIRIFYYISPQVWAWRTGRVRTLKRLVHTMAVILPFEGAFYEAHGMKVHYVGHPLMDVLGGAPGREEAALRYRAAGTSGAASGAGPLVGLLPGSRRGEVRTMLPILMESAALMHRQNPSLSFLLALAPSLDSAVASGVARDSKLPIRVVSNDTYGVMRACDLLVAVSGTVTLEAAILGAPMVVVYKVSALTAEFGRWLIKVKYAAMPNLIADREIAPELIQARATPERIAGTALGLLNDPGALERQRLELSRVRQWLGRPGVADRVAELVLDAMP